MQKNYIKNAISYLLEKKPKIFFFGKQINFKNTLIRIENDCNILIKK
jgi:hypothetical protein